MNRERLTILRDHLASLPDERLNMAGLVVMPDGVVMDGTKPIAEIMHGCGTAACVAGWANALFNGEKPETGLWTKDASVALGLNAKQEERLFYPINWAVDGHSRLDAIAAIQSMLDNPADDALPVWPEKAEA